MKKLSVFFVIVLVLLLPLTAFAENDWIINNDGTLYNGDIKYTKIQLAYSNDLVLPNTFDVYKTTFDDYTIYVQTLTTTDQFVTTGGYYSSQETYYATEEGLKTIERFNNGQFSKYLLVYLNSPSTTAGFNAAHVKELDSLTPTLTLLVSDLKDLFYYNVAGVDDTCTFSHIHGAIYESENCYYYINYDELDNSYFDSEGYFSYRKGQVKAVEVPDNLAREIDSALSHTNYKTFTFNETYDAYHTANETFSTVTLFVVSTIILGYIIPAIPFTLSLIFARSKKALRPKRWYILTIVSSVWMLFSTIINLIIILG